MTVTSANTTLSSWTFNDWADFWRHQIGVNVIPADTKNKRPIVEWKEYQNVPITEEQHNTWKADNLFSKGMAIIPGKVWHNKFKKGLNLVFVDLDNRKAIEEFCSRNGNVQSLEELAKHMIIEQHNDDPNKAHAYFYSRKTFPKKSSDRISDLSNKINRNEIPAIEVKGLGEHGIAYCARSPHKNGQNYEIIGTLEPEIIDDMIEHIDSICRKYNIPYLEANQKNKSKSLRPIYELFGPETKILEGHNRHEALLRVMESLIMRYRGILTEITIKSLAAEWNEKHCIPPLLDQEFEKLWIDAISFIEKKIKETEKPEPAAIRPVTEEDIDFVIQTIKKEARYDEPSIKQLFFGMATAFTRLGMGHKVNSKDSGAGKSYLTNKVASYFPDKHVLVLGGASNKAFQHKQGELVVKDKETGKLEPLEPLTERLNDELEQLDPKNKQNKKQIKDLEREIKNLKNQSQKLINLDNTIIVIQDTPQEGLFANLMSLISQDSDKDQEYIFVDDKLQGKSNIIHGMPVIFYTRVNDDSRNARAEETFRRFVNVTPSATKEKVQEANRITFKRHGLLPEEYDEQVVSKEDKERAKEIVANMGEHLKSHTQYLGPKESGIGILFEETLSHAMPSHDVYQMTVSDRLARYLGIITKAKMGSRPSFVNKITGAFYPIPTFGDLKEAFRLMEIGGSNIRPYLVAMYNDVIYPLYSQIDGPGVDKGKDKYGNEIVIAKENYKGLRVQEIIEGAKEILHLTISAKELYTKYLTPMVELGLINWARSVLKGSEKIYYPADPDSRKVHSLFSDGDLRLKVTDKSFYPTKEVLEQSYGFSSKLSSKPEGKKNIFDIYRLEDHQGKEITLSEIIDRYLFNPELCFKIGWNELEPTDRSFDKMTGFNQNICYSNQILMNHLNQL